MRRTMLAAAAALVMLAGAGQGAQAQYPAPVAGDFAGSDCLFGGDVCIAWHVTWAPVAEGMDNGTYNVTMTASSPTRTAVVMTGAGLPFQRGAGFYLNFGGTYGFVGTETRTASGNWSGFTAAPVLLDWSARMDDWRGGPFAANSVYITATPEPASLALLATGLLGLGGVAMRRRGARS